MKKYTRKFDPQAAELLKSLAPEIKKNLRAITDTLLANPYLGKPLQKELLGFHSVKHTHYRIIYSINEKDRTIIIEYVGLRKTIYQAFAELIKPK